MYMYLLADEAAFERMTAAEQKFCQGYANVMERCLNSSTHACWLAPASPRACRARVPLGFGRVCLTPPSPVPEGGSHADAARIWWQAFWTSCLRSSDG